MPSTRFPVSRAVEIQGALDSNLGFGKLRGMAVDKTIRAPPP